MSLCATVRVTAAALSRLAKIALQVTVISFSHRRGPSGPAFGRIMWSKRAKASINSNVETPIKWSSWNKLRKKYSCIWTTRGNSIWCWPSILLTNISIQALVRGKIISRALLRRNIRNAPPKRATFEQALIRVEGSNVGRTILRDIKSHLGIPGKICAPEWCYTFVQGVVIWIQRLHDAKEGTSEWRIYGGRRARFIERWVIYIKLR